MAACLGRGVVRARPTFRGDPHRVRHAGRGRHVPAPRRHPPDAEHADAVIAAFLEEWNTGVSDIDGVPEMLHDLAIEHRLAVVSNTHDPGLVPDHLERLGIASYLEVVVLAVEVGVKKPHPHIYETALRMLGARPEDAVFVGDTVDADHTGPVHAGMRALLIGEDATVPPSDRIASVTEVPSALHRLEAEATAR